MEDTELQNLAVIHISDIGKPSEFIKLTVPCFQDEIRVDSIIKKVCELKGVKGKTQRYFGILLGDDRPLKKYRSADQLILPLKGYSFQKWCFSIKTEKKLVKSDPVIAQLFFQQAQHDINIGKLKATPDQLTKLQECLDPEFFAVDQYLSICHGIKDYCTVNIHHCQLLQDFNIKTISLPQNSYCNLNISMKGLTITSEDSSIQFMVQWYQICSWKLNKGKETLSYCLQQLNNKSQYYLPLKSDQCEYILAVTLEMINDLQAEDEHAPSFYITNIKHLADGCTVWENILFDLDKVR